MPVKMLVTDLDGTLLNDNSKIPDKNKRAIKTIREKGIRFVICSGRSYLSLDSYIEELGFKAEDEYAIAFNGGCVYTTSGYEVLREYLLENGIMKEILKEIAPFKADKFVYDKDSILLSCEDSEGFNSYRSFSKIPARLIGSFEEIEGDVSKIILKGSSAELKRIYDYLLPMSEGRVNIFFSSERLLEVSHLEADKGKAVKFLAEHLGYNQCEIMAVGDNYNDISMLEAAGRPVAVSNAVGELKQRAAYVLNSSNNDGAFHEIAENYL